MSFEIDKNVDLERAKDITLGGRKLKVAPLVLRSIIVALQLQPKLAQDMSPSDRVDLLMDFVLLGLKRTYPTATTEDLLESEATVAELQEAVWVVIEQSNGGKTRKELMEAVKEAGEQKAAALSDHGAGSSPSSALN